MKLKTKLGRIQTTEEFVEAVKLLQRAVSEIYYFAEPADLVNLGEWLKNQLGNPNFDFFVVLDNGTNEMVGIGYGYKAEFDILKNPVYFVETVYIRPEYRKSDGLFKLMHALNKQSKRSGLTTISYLFADNKRKDGMPTIAKRFATEKKPFLVAFYREGEHNYGDSTSSHQDTDSTGAATEPDSEY